MPPHRGRAVNNVVLLGLVSFFADLSTEMVYPLIPLYLTSAFGATPAVVGLIEGIAESLAGLLKVFSGYLADRYRRKKPLAFAGYAAGLVYKAGLLLAGSWAGVLAARVVDRVGKGVRTSPRDVLVSESAAPGKLGLSFGLHKALDMAGSTLGILAAFFLMRSPTGDYDYRRLFLLSCIPAAASLVMFAFIRETGTRVAQGRPPRVTGGLRSLDYRLRLYLTVVFLFTLGNSSNAFLLLRASDAGFETSSVILLYLLYNGVSSLLALPLGKWSDRTGRKRMLVAGYVVFTVAYAGFAWAGSRLVVASAFAVYGVFTAMTAGVERAYISEIAPSELKGTMLGLHSTLVGVALFPASLIAGFLWSRFGPEVTFSFGAALSLAAALLLAFRLPTASVGTSVPRGA